MRTSTLHRDSSVLQALARLCAAIRCRPYQMLSSKRRMMRPPRVTRWLWSGDKLWSLEGPGIGGFIKTLSSEKIAAQAAARRCRQPATAELRNSEPCFKPHTTTMQDCDPRRIPIRSTDMFGIFPPASLANDRDIYGIIPLLNVELLGLLLVRLMLDTFSSIERFRSLY